MPVLKLKNDIVKTENDVNGFQNLGKGRFLISNLPLDAENIGKRQKVPIASR